MALRGNARMSLSCCDAGDADTDVRISAANALLAIERK